MPPMPHCSFDTCAVHFLGPEGSTVCQDFEELQASMTEWGKRHPKAMVLPADRFPMSGWVASYEEDGQEVWHSWLIHMRDLKKSRNKTPVSPESWLKRNHGRKQV